jgi:hypothetical protein
MEYSYYIIICPQSPINVPVVFRTDLYDININDKNVITVTEKGTQDIKAVFINMSGYYKIDGKSDFFLKEFVRLTTKEIDLLKDKKIICELYENYMAEIEKTNWYKKILIKVKNKKWIQS